LLQKELSNKRLDNCELILCPPFINLEIFRSAKTKKIQLGGQNMFWENKGSYTGEVSPLMLKNYGCEYVILGHSERRKFCHENDGEINLKVKAALKNDLKPIICIGESVKGGDDGFNVVEKQLNNCLKDVSRGKIEKVIVCYEPVWAISSNNPDHPPTANEIMSAKLFIKKFLVEKYGAKTADKVNIIYGGSVAADSAEEVCVNSEMGGALIGKASLSPHEFVKIAEILN
jgi:triosephosphate isomerase